MDVWIALVGSDQPYEFRFLICDSKHATIQEYLDGNMYISNIGMRKFAGKSIQEILEFYRYSIEMDNYKNMKVYDDDHAAEIVYKKGIEKIVAGKTGLEIAEED